MFKDSKNERRNDGTKERRNDRTKERKNEGTMERGDDRTKERKNEGTMERGDDRTKERKGEGVGGSLYFPSSFHSLINCLSSYFSLGKSSQIICQTISAFIPK